MLLGIPNWGIPFVFIFMALIVATLTGYYSIALILVILAIIFSINPFKKIIVSHKAIITFLAIIFVSVIFGLFHTSVYSQETANLQSAVLGAMLFGVFVSYLNEFIGNTIGGQMTHIIANSVTYLDAVPSGYILVGIIIAGYVSLILICYHFDKHFKFINPIKVLNV